MAVHKMRSSVITKKNKTEHNVIRVHTFRPPLERPRNTMPLPLALPVIIIKHDNKSPSARFCCHFPNLSGRWARERGRRGGAPRPAGEAIHALPLEAYLFSANGAEELTEIKYCLLCDSDRVIILSRPRVIRRL